MASPRTQEARNAAAFPVGQAIHHVETSINTSIVRIGELIASVGHARLNMEARMPLTIGLAATEQAALAAGALSAAYRHSVEAHRHLSDDKATLGLKTVAWGDFWPTYNQPSGEDSARDDASVEPQPLRIVA
jgi:hypothetical protein